MTKPEHMLIQWDTCHGTVSKVRVFEVEQHIKIKLPHDFVELVKQCDGGTPIKSTFRYYNISHKTEWEDGIGRFLPLNPERYGLLETYLSPPEFFADGIIAFGETGGGDYICFDYRQGRKTLNPAVVYWDHEASPGKDVSFISGNFEEFIKLLKEPEDLEEDEELDPVVFEEMLKNAHQGDSLVPNKKYAEHEWWKEYLEDDSKKMLTVGEYIQYLQDCVDSPLRGIDSAREYFVNNLKTEQTYSIVKSAVRQVDPNIMRSLIKMTLSSSRFFQNECEELLHLMDKQ